MPCRAPEATSNPALILGGNWKLWASSVSAFIKLTMEFLVLQNSSNMSQWSRKTVADMLRFGVMDLHSFLKGIILIFIYFLRYGSNIYLNKGHLKV